MTLSSLLLLARDAEDGDDGDVAGRADQLPATSRRPTPADVAA